MKKTKITTIVGTRPELIRLSVIINKLDEVFDHRFIYTGQNSDARLSDIFFEELNIRDPDLVFNNSNSTFGSFLAYTCMDLERELSKYRPDAIVILGDTNSALSGIVAKRMGIKIYHLEAGNRSFDSNVPEEINRGIIDRFSDYNLAYTTNAKQNLLREGFHPLNLAVIGSPLCEVITLFKNSIDESKILTKLGVDSFKYFLVSAHRQENVDDSVRLQSIIDSINEVALIFKQPIIFSIHPRTKKNLLRLNLKINSLVRLHEPFSFFEYCKLQINARMVLSDSGSISEEAVILGFKAITIRDSMERLEALESGSVVMSGIEKEDIIKSIGILEINQLSKFPPREYLISDTSTRLINFIMSSIHRSNSRIL